MLKYREHVCVCAGRRDGEGDGLQQTEHDCRTDSVPAATSSQSSARSQAKLRLAPRSVQLSQTARTCVPPV